MLPAEIILEELRAVRAELAALRREIKRTDPEPVGALGMVHILSSPDPIAANAARVKERALQRRRKK